MRKVECRSPIQKHELTQIFNFVTCVGKVLSVDNQLNVEKAFAMMMIKISDQSLRINDNK